jgi:hypothetical protein
MIVVPVRAPQEVGPSMKRNSGQIVLLTPEPPVIAHARQLAILDEGGLSQHQAECARLSKRQHHVPRVRRRAGARATSAKDFATWLSAMG